jgi:hypothetical protein
MTKNLLAGSVPLGPINGIGPLGNPGSTPALTLSNLISTVIGLLTVIAALYFLISLVTASISIISAGGDEGKYQAARQKITTGIIGLAVSIAGIFIMDVIATLLGMPTILDLVTTIAQIQVQ